MADFYYNQTDRRKTKKRSLGMILLDTITLILSVACFVALTLTLVTSYYDPSISWIFPTLGLISPAVYLASTLLALYWIIRWRWLYAAFLLLPLAVGAPSISRYAKMESSKSYRAMPKRGTIKLMSYNVKGFINDAGQSSNIEMKEFIEEQRPDIICFQEFAENRMKEDDEPEILQKYYRSKVRELAIFSRYKILDSSENLVRSDFDSGSGFWADILVGSDTLRLYNIHLHSTAITRTDNDYISNMEFLSDTLSEDIFKGMLSRFKNTSIGRASQADSIAYSISQTPHRVIVCGDFNDTPNSYAYRRISHGLKDTFQEAGVGYSYTFRGFLNLLRIDYILVDQPTEVLLYEVVDTILLSDHLPVTTTLKL